MALPLRMDPLCRKRSRNANEDEASEFTPLSKRINNLHLNTTFPMPKSLAECEPKVETHKDHSATNDRLPSLQYSNRPDEAPLASPPPLATAQQWPPSYTPDLTPAQNPFYYETNRLLFELYQQRIQRQPPSTHF